MAELHVQRKESNIWPWIIGALLLAAVLWFVFMRADTRNVASTNRGNTADSMYQTQPTQTQGSAASPNTPGRP